MDVCIYEIVTLQHCSTDYVENWHAYVFFCGEGFCAILSAAPYQVTLQQINQFPSCQNGGQHFAMFPLNRHDIPSGHGSELKGDRGSLVVKVTDSWLACHEFEFNTTEDPPCRGDDAR
ncbi:hypothetical protein TNCV_4020961 [Trichonephila clavipes]|nr:hypothetical protein TNCV_4020961 [Trichonephila clavipes]